MTNQITKGRLSFACCLVLIVAVLFLMIAFGMSESSGEVITVDDDGGGFIPGFGTISIIGSIGCAITLTLIKRKNED